MVTVFAGSALSWLASWLVDLLAFNVLPEKVIYREYKTQLTPAGAPAACQAGCAGRAASRCSGCRGGWAPCGPRSDATPGGAEGDPRPRRGGPRGRHHHDVVADGPADDRAVRGLRVHCRPMTSHAHACTACTNPFFVVLCCFPVVYLSCCCFSSFIEIAIYTTVPYSEKCAKVHMPEPWCTRPRRGASTR